MPVPLYKPLDPAHREIRLLTILPCKNDDEPVSCRLENARLGPRLDYAAMSYVWGDQTATTDILINGTAFPVTENLALGLWHFRKYGITSQGPGPEEIRLWVDAVCMNQQDVPERNQQVAMMGSVYSGASFVVAWLGMPGNGKVDQCLRITRDFARGLPADLVPRIVSLYDNKSSGRGDGKSDPTAMGDCEAELSRRGLEWISGHPEMHEDDEPNTEVTGWDSFVHLVSLPYWKRVWVMQERVLSRSFKTGLFRSGGEQATFEDLIVFFHLIDVLGKASLRPPKVQPIAWRTVLATFGAAVVHPVLRLKEMAALRGSGHTFPEYVLWAAAQCRATDPRDMVYGVLGVLGLQLRPDYDKTARQVYLEWHGKLVYERTVRPVSAQSISRAGVGLYEDRALDLPSWLPDLSRLHEERYVLTDHPDRPGRFSAVGTSPEEYSVDGVLSVDAAPCDRVTRITPLTDDLDGFDEVVAVDYALYMGSRRHPLGLRPLHAWYCTMHQGIDPDTGEEFSSSLDPESMQAQMFLCSVSAEQTTTLGQHWSGIDLESLGGIGPYLASQFYDYGDLEEKERWRKGILGFCEDDAMEYARSIIDILEFFEHKSVFYTAEGYIGIGPKYTRAGDRVFLLDNCALPVILRGEGTTTALVGAAYVYGLLGSRPLDMIKAGGLQLQRIEIH